MQGILLISHGSIAQSILETSKMFFGEQEQFECCCMKQDDNPDDYLQFLKNTIKDIDTSDGVIVVCDLFGGTPCNCMIKILIENNDNSIRLLSGLNLATVLELLSARKNGKVDIDDIIQTSKDNIIDINKYLDTKIDKL